MYAKSSCAGVVLATVLEESCESASDRAMARPAIASNKGISPRTFMLRFSLVNLRSSLRAKGSIASAGIELRPDKIVSEWCHQRCSLLLSRSRLDRAGAADRAADAARAGPRAGGL